VLSYTYYVHTWVTIIKGFDALSHCSLLLNFNAFSFCDC